MTQRGVRGIPPQFRRPPEVDVVNYPRALTYGGAGMTVGILTLFALIAVAVLFREPVKLVIVLLGGVLLLAGVLLIKKRKRGLTPASIPAD